MSNEYICTFEERISKEGKPYKVLAIHITDTYEILHFPKTEQIELIKIYSKVNK